MKFTSLTASQAIEAIQKAKVSSHGQCWVMTQNYQAKELAGSSVIRFLHQILPKIKEVKTWLVALEENPGVWRLSARALSDIQLGLFFHKYGGGGHSAAAGASVTSNLQLIVEDFEAYVGLQLKELNCF